MKPLLIALAILFLTKEASGQESVTAPVAQESVTAPTAMEKHSRVMQEIPIERNAHVQVWLNFFTEGRGREVYALWLERSKFYFPIFRKVLKESGMPEDLCYLAMIESGLNDKAISSASAGGLWQFMPATGRLYGLNATLWLDERYDIEKSTRAAAAYLKDSYRLYGDWYLAFASYNAGQGKISRGLRRYGVDSFWELRDKRYLAAETKSYVPIFIAAMIIGKDPERYGFVKPNYEAKEYTYISVHGPIDLKRLAENANVSYEALKRLNPELRFYVTPPNETYPLRVSEQVVSAVLAAIHKAPKPTLVVTYSHRRTKAATVLQRYGIQEEQLLTRAYGSYRKGQVIIFMKPSQ